MSEEKTKDSYKEVDSQINQLKDAFKQTWESWKNAITNLIDVKIDDVSLEDIAEHWIYVCGKQGRYFTERNEICFEKGSFICKYPKIDLYHIWNAKGITDDIRNLLWEYMQVMYVQAVSYKMGMTLEELRDWDIPKDSNITLVVKPKNIEIAQIILREINRRQTSDTRIDAEQDDEELKKLFGENDPQSMFEKMFSKFGGASNLTDILDSKIGKLAKDIADELGDELTNELQNTDEINNIIQSISSGDISALQKSPWLRKLMEKVIKKIQNKIKEGSISEEDLLQEAQEMMKKMDPEGKMGDPETMAKGLFGDNPKMQEMVQKMAQGIMKQQAKMQGNRGVKPASYNKTKDRLKRELEMRKERLEQKKRELEKLKESVGINNLKQKHANDIAQELINEFENKIEEDTKPKGRRNKKKTYKHNKDGK